MAAAFVANVYVFIYLLAKKEKKWREHILSLVLVAILFLPWLTLFTTQIEKVQHAFWAPEPCFSTILSCFTIPFTEQFWISNYSNALIILMYTLITTTVILSFLRRFAEYRLTLWMSLTIFLATLLLASLISLFSQPILYSRYVMAIASMLVVAPTLLLMTIRSRWLKTIIIAAILVLGLRVSFSTYYFSYGPYKQTIEYIASTYPHIKKIVHLAEITAGPMIEYSENSGLGHYWLNAQMSNVDAFSTISQHSQPSEFLQQGEEFCVVRFQDLELNKENLDHILSESELIKKDTIRDSKVTDGIIIQLYLLKYKGLD
ncbi:MAG: hypothetical protein GXX78_00120 [Bacteroidales bacterium]|nr:hypothetical protein [Bacteroidales bacterium]